MTDEPIDGVPHTVWVWPPKHERPLEQDILTASGTLVVLIIIAAAIIFCLTGGDRKTNRLKKQRT